MTRYFRLVLLVTLAAGPFLLAGDTDARSPVRGYMVTDLGTLGGAESQAYAVNELGHVAGSADTIAFDTHDDAVRHGYLWHDGEMDDLGSIDGTNSDAYGLNDRDEVVGGTGRGAFLWRRDTGLAQLKPPENPFDTPSFYYADAINNAGQIVGFGNVHGDPIGLLVTGEHQQHYQLTGGAIAEINSRGQMVGSEMDNSGDSAGVVWELRDGSVHRVRRLRPWDFGDSFSSPNSINNHGLIVGEVDGFAYLWTALGSIRLGTLPGFAHSFASSINEVDQVVGTAYTHYDDDGNPLGHAFLWRPRLGMMDLNQLIPANPGWVLNDAASINNRGQIAGTGLHNGVRRGFLLTPN